MPDALRMASMTGAILMASGRVPNTMSAVLVVMRETFPQKGTPPRAAVGIQSTSLPLPSWERPSSAFNRSWVSLYSRLSGECGGRDDATRHARWQD